MKKMAVLVVLAGLAFSGIALAEKEELKPQTACPVMGGKINKDV